MKSFAKYAAALVASCLALGGAARYGALAFADSNRAGNAIVDNHSGSCSDLTYSNLSFDAGTDWCVVLQGPSPLFPQYQLSYEIDTNVDISYRTSPLPDGGPQSYDGDKMLFAGSVMGPRQVSAGSFTVSLPDAGTFTWNQVMADGGTMICIHQQSLLTTDGGIGRTVLAQCN